MITVKQLKELLDIYQSQKAIFSPNLDAKTLKIMQQEAAYTFSFFTQLIQARDEESSLDKDSMIIRKYLKIRWAHLKKSNLAYTRHPFLPANQLCLKVAEAIAGPKEAICQILMPGLVGLNRKSAELKFETESEGHFELENYVINQAHNRLIPVAEIFQTAKVDSNLVIADFQPADNQVVYQLGGRDMLNLEQVAGKASETFIQVLKKQHSEKYDNNSIGFSLYKLALELKKASVADSGSEEWADNEVVAGAIKTFYELWRNLPNGLCLPHPINTPISQLSLKSYGRAELTLESYLLALFARHKDCTLTDEEFKREQKENIFPCAYQISNCLFEFLNQYPDLYKLPIEVKLTQAKEELPSLGPLLDEVLEVLAHRPQMLDGNDEGLLGQLIQLIRESSTYHSVTAATFIEPFIQSFQDFSNLTANSELFKEVAALVQPRFAELTSVAGIDKLIHFFSKEQQQLIVDVQFNALVQEYNTEAKYQKLMANLVDPAKSSFRKKYAAQLIPSITSCQDFLQLSKTVSSELLDEVFASLEDKYPVLLNSYDNTRDILKALSLFSNQRKKVLAFVKPNLYQWLNPDNYDSFYQSLLIYDAAELHRIMVDEISSRITSFKEWTTHYVAWKNHEFQSDLLDQLFLKFKDEIKDGDALLSLLQKTKNRYKLKAIEKFHSLLNSKELFEQSLTLMPGSTHQRFLSTIAFDSFVFTIPELQKIVDLFQSDELRQIIFTQFNPKKLNCTEEEFASLTQYKFELKKRNITEQDFDPQTVIDQLQQYVARQHPRYGFFKSTSDERVQMAIAIIRKLEDDSLSLQEKFNAVVEAQDQIKREYQSIGSSARHSQLYSILNESLNKNVESQENFWSALQSFRTFSSSLG
ncbi:Uncharacterised protein [Legionella steigerwaltii]|uniref:Uncharacterized protein n=1 Tax=Legionella steigerwaltii TaxID=460 RepID=A0A378L924_9GAMM|nr:hypothetical protein [Legionella steigerwaltii]KTD81094.1 hypothetical protein Lstg_0321 [Legionella steigerwaltii]STY23217.1 Uncharacterised protein [Legionella steigerwaltii]